MLYARCIVPAFLLTLSSLVYADVSAPQTGEMALRGEITGLDSTTGQITIKAQSFELPGGRSKVISPPKLKKILSTSAKITDLRIGLNVPLNDLHLKQSIRVVGKDGGASLPFRARALEFTSSVPSEPDEGIAPPAVAALLPASQSFKRLNLRIVDAGFAPPSALGDKDNEWQQQMNWPGFYLSYRIRVPRSVRPNEMVQFTGLRGPRGILVSEQASNSGGSMMPFVGTNLFFRSVDPGWETVSAEFEVQDPNAPLHSNGKYETDASLTNIPLPVQDKTTPDKPAETKPNLVYTSPQGVKYTLTSIKFEGSGYRMQWEYEPPAGAEDLDAELQRVRIIKSSGTNNSWTNSNESWNKKGFEVYLWSVPKDAKTVDISFKLVETSRAWRSADAFKRVSFEIPVKKLATLAPLRPQKPATEPIIVRGQNIEARWETERGGWNDFTGSLWIRSLANSPDDTANQSSQWLTREVKGFLPNGKELERIWPSMRDEGWVFRSDYTQRSSGETASTQQISLPDGNERPESIELRYKIERARVANFAHRFENISLPAPGGKREFSPDDFSDETLALRRIQWVRSLSEIPEDKRSRFTERGRGFLLLTFDRTRIFDSNESNFSQVRIFDDKGESSKTYYASWNSDPLSENPQSGSQWTIQMVAPYTGAKTLGIALQTSERKWMGQTENITIPNIKVPPRPQ